MKRSISILAYLLLSTYIFASDLITPIEDIKVSAKHHYNIALTGSGTTGSGTISGSVYTCFGDPLKNATMELNSNQANFPMELLTDENGEYCFGDVEDGYNYTVTPSKNDDLLNGVSTWDLILLHRFIRVNPNHEPACKFIAADINNDEQINIADVINLLYNLLGRLESFNQNTSWKFYDASFTFIGDKNPWPFPQSIDINNFLTESANNDFVAVKIGDLSGDANPQLFKQAQIRSTEISHLNTTDIYLRENQEYTVDFRLNQNFQIQGFQAEFDLSTLDILEVESDIFLVEDQNTFRTDSGLKLIMFDRLDNNILTGNETVLKLKVKAKQDGFLSTLLAFHDNTLKPEIYSGDENLIARDLSLAFSKDVQITSTFTVYQNVPNPFLDQSSIRFTSPASGQAILELFDTTGKRIHTEGVIANQGINTIAINRSLFPLTGMYLYKVSLGNLSQTKTLIVME